MIYQKETPTVEDITNLYLCCTLEKPSDMGTLAQQCRVST